MPNPQPSNKPRVVKDYDKLDAEVVEQIKLTYPRGYQRNLVTFKNAKGDTVSALPFETEDRYYLVRMTIKEAIAIIEEDEDYDEDGILKPKVKRAYTDKHADDDDDDLPDDLDLELDEMGFGDEDADDDFDGDGKGSKGGTVSLDGVDIVDPGTT